MGHRLLVVDFLENTQLGAQRETRVINELIFGGLNTHAKGLHTYKCMWGTTVAKRCVFIGVMSKKRNSVGMSRCRGGSKSAPGQGSPTDWRKNGGSPLQQLCLAHKLKSILCQAPRSKTEKGGGEQNTHF